MGFSWRGGDVGGLSRLGSGLEPVELRSAAAMAVRASFAELDRLEVGASYRSVIAHPCRSNCRENARPSRASAFLKTLFCLQAPCLKKGVFLLTCRERRDKIFAAKTENAKIFKNKLQSGNQFSVGNFHFFGRWKNNFFGGGITSKLASQ